MPDEKAKNVFSIKITYFFTLVCNYSTPITNQTNLFFTKSLGRTQHQVDILHCSTCKHKIQDSIGASSDTIITDPIKFIHHGVVKPFGANITIILFSFVVANGDLGLQFGDEKSASNSVKRDTDTMFLLGVVNLIESLLVGRQTFV